MFKDGQIMTCFSCGKKKKRNPHKQSQWTYISLAGKSGYCCPACLQDSPEGKRGDFAAAYERVLKKLLKS